MNEEPLLDHKTFSDMKGKAIIGIISFIDDESDPEILIKQSSDRNQNIPKTLKQTEGTFSPNNRCLKISATSPTKISPVKMSSRNIKSTLISPKSTTKSSPGSKLSDLQKQNLMAHTAKMKELFLKEYEQLITEKNDQINKLSQRIRDLKHENKHIKSENQDFS